jgi:hypothetical protein
VELAAKLKESNQSVMLLHDKNLQLSFKLISSEGERLEGQSNLLAAESLLSQEKKKREIAEDPLKTEWLVSKCLRDQMHYYRQQLQKELEKKSRQCFKSSNDMDHLCELRLPLEL